MKRLLGLLLLTAGVAGANATILTFGGLDLGNYGTIDQSYGDNVTNTGSAPTGTYEMGNGWTGNVTTSYQTVDAVGTQTFDHVDYWNTNYGDLTDVAFAAQNGNYARITLTPDASHSVRLNSFDLAGWPDVDYVADRIHVIDSAGNVLWDGGTTVHGAGATHSSFSPNLVSNGALTIEFGTNWDIGIDNINFDQDRPVVPEPASMAALGLGIAALIRKRRKA